MRSLFFTLFMAATCSQISSAATLTGATLFSANSQGTATGEIWNTLGNDVLFNLYLLNGSTPLNSGSGSGASINIPLNTAGTYSYIFRAQPGLLTPTYFGLNLFFNGNQNTPAISALVGANGNTFTVNTSSSTPSLTGLPVVAAANSLIFLDGVRITLTALSESRSGGNSVSAYSNTPGIVPGNDYTGGFTLSVATPEPSTYLMLGSALTLVGLVRRKSSR